MKRSKAQEISRLQRKLIPVNIVVCILCIVACVTMFFMPLMKIDLGTVIGNEAVKETVKNLAISKLNEFMENAGGSDKNEEDNSTETAVYAVEDGAGETEDGTEGELPPEGEKEPGEGENPDKGETAPDPDGGNEEVKDVIGNINLAELLKNIDIEELVTPIVDKLFDNVQASVTISVQNSFKVFVAEDKIEVLLNELFLNESSGFIANFQKTLVSGMGTAFHEAGTQIQSAMIRGFVSPVLKELLPESLSGLINEDELEDVFKSLNNDAKSSEQACDIIINYVDGLAANSEDMAALTDKEKEDISNVITELYDKTVAETGEGNFSFEAMLSITASEMLDGVGDGFNIGGILGGFFGGSGGQDEPQEPSETLRKASMGGIIGVEGEAGDDVAKVNRPLTFKELGENLAKSFLGEDLTVTVKTKIIESAGDYAEYFGYYGYAFIGMGFFMLLWLILFVFSFIHMFAKNKRFTMWYVKLFCAWPCILFFVVPWLAQTVLVTAFPEVVTSIAGAFSGLGITLEGEAAAGVVTAVISAFKSSMWISGVCYLVLWAVSIFWAFPIKHKIRKLKKQY